MEITPFLLSNILPKDIVLYGIYPQLCKTNTVFFHNEIIQYVHMYNCIVIMYDYHTESIENDMVRILNDGYPLINSFSYILQKTFGSMQRMFPKNVFITRRLWSIMTHKQKHQMHREAKIIFNFH